VLWFLDIKVAGNPLTNHELQIHNPIVRRSLDQTIAQFAQRRGQTPVHVGLPKAFSAPCLDVFPNCEWFVVTMRVGHIRNRVETFLTNNDISVREYEYRFVGIDKSTGVVWHFWPDDLRGLERLFAAHSLVLKTDDDVNRIWDLFKAFRFCPASASEYRWTGQGSCEFVMGTRPLRETVLVVSVNAQSVITQLTVIERKRPVNRT
jgi:hypothetical protein